MNADVPWLACIFPTSWLKSHMLWATEVWANNNHKVPLSPLGFPAWSTPCQLFLDLGHPALTSVLAELQEHHRDPANRNSAEGGFSHHVEGALFSRSITWIALPGMSGQIPGESKQPSPAVCDRAAPKRSYSCLCAGTVPMSLSHLAHHPEDHNLFDITHVFVILGGWLEGDGKGLGVNDLHQLYKQGKTAGLCFLLGAFQASVLCELPP